MKTVKPAKPAKPAKGTPHTVTTYPSPLALTIVSLSGHPGRKMGAYDAQALQTQGFAAVEAVKGVTAHVFYCEPCDGGRYIAAIPGGAADAATARKLVVAFVSQRDGAASPLPPGVH